MKKLLVLALVLSMATMASAVMTIGVDKTSILEGEDVTITMSSADVIPQGQYVLGIVSGGTGTAELGILGVTINYPGEGSFVEIMDDSETLGSIGFDNLAVNMSLTDTVEPIADVVGTLVSGINLHGLTSGTLTIAIFDSADAFAVVGTQDITITPEPVTLGLLGLGALFLRRRK